MSKLTQEDFPEPIPEKLLEELNRIDAETDKLHARLEFLNHHNFQKEAEWTREKIGIRSIVYVAICHSLGKSF